MDGGEPDIPIYKVIECTGPTNTRVYKVAVYFRGKRLASSTGHSIQQAEMEAAKKALENSSELFPQLDYQKRVMAHSMKRQKGKPFDGDRKHGRSIDLHRSLRKEDDSNLPKQYRVREVSKGKSPYESNAESYTDTDSSNSAYSGCSASKSEKKKTKHKVKHNYRRTECRGRPIIEELQSNTYTNIVNDSATNDIKTDNINSSDTDISLESGEIL